MRDARRTVIIGAAALALAALLTAPPASATPGPFDDERLKYPGVFPVQVHADTSVAQFVTDSRWIVGSRTTDGVTTVFRIFTGNGDDESLSGFDGGPAQARDVNEAGDVVGVGVGPDGLPHPYGWAAGGPTVQLTGAGVTGEATGVNRHRLVAGTVDLPQGRRAVVWSVDAQRTVDTGGVVPSRAAPRDSVNDRGQVTGTAGASGAERAFVWRDGVLTWLSTPDGATSESLGITENGHVRGTISTLGAVVWQPDGTVRRLDPRGLGFVPTDISERGEVVGVVPVGGGDTRPAIVRRGGEVALLRSFGGYVGAAQAVNERGVTAGWTRTARYGADHATYWHRDVPWRAGEELSERTVRAGHAYDVNEDDWIVGSVQVRDRTGTRWVDIAALWELVPEF